MDAIIDLKDASKALDLSNIRYQLMYTKLALLTPCSSRNANKRCLVG